MGDVTATVCERVGALLSVKFLAFFTRLGAISAFRIAGAFWSNIARQQSYTRKELYTAARVAGALTSVNRDRQQGSGKARTAAVLARHHPALELATSIIDPTIFSIISPPS